MKRLLIPLLVLAALLLVVAFWPAAENRVPDPIYIV